MPEIKIKLFTIEMKCSNLIFFISVLLLIVSNGKNFVSSGGRVETAPQTTMYAVQPNVKQITAVNHNQGNGVDLQGIIREIDKIVETTPHLEEPAVIDKYASLLDACSKSPLQW